MSYTATQTKAAKENAALHGFTQPVSDALAIQFLDWYHTNRQIVPSVAEAKHRGLAQDFSGSSSIHNQIAWWQERIC